MFRVFLWFGFKSLPFVAALTPNCQDCCKWSFCHLIHTEWKREGGGNANQNSQLLTYSLCFLSVCITVCVAQHIIRQARSKADRKSLQDEGE